MKFVLPIALLATFVFSTQAKADGNKLLAQCTAAVQFSDGVKNPTGFANIGYCLGFMQGVTQTVRVYGELTDDKSLLFCQPKDGIENGQAARIVVKYLNDHPEELHKGELELALSALFKAFPCPSASGH